MKPCYVYGAQAIAYGIARALERGGQPVAGYVVTNLVGNPAAICGKKVVSLASLEQAKVYVAVPEYLHKEIAGLLLSRGFTDYVLVDAELEYSLMKSFYQGEARLSFWETSDQRSEILSDLEGLEIYVAMSLHDKKLQGPVSFPASCVSVQAGAALGPHMETDFHDDEGENISLRNGHYDELTVTYWAWKNSQATVKGIAHYRRCLMLTESERCALLTGKLDVLLPMPFLCYPDTSMQYGRYNTPQAVAAMLDSLGDLYGREERETAVRVLQGDIIYNYNMLIARSEVFDAYCSWMFPVLEQVEHICADQMGKVAHSRVCGHLGELLLTIYMLAHGQGLKIAHGKKKWFP